MEATRTIEARRQRLIEKAARRNMKSKRLQKKIQHEGQRKRWLELESGRTYQPNTSIKDSATWTERMRQEPGWCVAPA